MEKNPATIIALVIMWVVCSLAGIAFLRNAIMEQTPRKINKVARIAREVRFRARLFAGLLLLLWVAASVVWMLVKWL